MTSIDLIYLISGSLFLLALVRLPAGQTLQSMLALACAGFAVIAALQGYLPAALLNTAMLLFLLYKGAYTAKATEA